MKVAAAIAAMLAIAALPVVALGHAELVFSDPGDGATITTPSSVTAVFDEEIDPEASSLIVENAAGEQIATGTVDLDDPVRMTADLPAQPDGVYTVRWTAVSADDAAVERGTYTFNVGGVTTTPPPSSTSGDTIPRGEEVAIALALAAVIVGAIVFLVLRRRI